MIGHRDLHGVEVSMDRYIKTDHMLKMYLRWLLEATISFDIATFFLPVRAISKCSLSPCGPCNYKKFIDLLIRIFSNKGQGSLLLNLIILFIFK